MTTKPTLVFIGAGNLATQTALALYNRGFQILQIYSRTETSAKSLAEKCNCSYTTDISQINKTADIYLYAVKDDALAELIERNPVSTGIHAHTAGSVDISIFENKKPNYGVFYPLQTFSKNKSVIYENIPIFVEANSNENLTVLESLGRSLSCKVEHCDSNQRQSLHLAAVFSSNFTNYMYQIADKILTEHQLDFNAILPLIHETTEKLNTLKPVEAQTGPAIRYDTKIINKHLDALKNMPEEQELYALISKMIFNSVKNK